MTKPGRVFSIEEFSTFDGPGIRMTVFLKGCPLHCPWCHNPEGQRFAVEYLRARNGCTGCGAPEMFERGLAVCDFVLYDLKLYDAGAHKAVCGVDNTLILHNYRTLVRSGKAFITRVPLIPGITDTEENLTALAAFMRDCGVTAAEVLPYNSLQGSKYASLLRQYAFIPGKEIPPERVELIFSSFGIRADRI